MPATLIIKVVPGASRSKIAGPYGDALKIQIAAAPERGQANEAIVDLLAKTLGIKKSEIEITHGHTQSRKTIQIASLDQSVVNQKLGLNGATK